MAREIRTAEEPSRRSNHKERDGHTALRRRIGVGSDGGGCLLCQAEDGIRDVAVTGVQTCALPIYLGKACSRNQTHVPATNHCDPQFVPPFALQSLTRRTPENQQSHRNSKTKQGRVTLQSSKPCKPERVDSLRDNRSSRPELLANGTKNLFPPRILAQRVSKERKVQKRGGGIVPRQNGGFQRSAERAQVRPKRKVSAQNPSKCHSQVGARVNPALACAPSHTGNWLASCEKP